MDLFGAGTGVGAGSARYGGGGLQIVCMRPAVRVDIVFRDGRFGGVRGVAVKAIPIVQVDNDRLLVTEWSFLLGAETGRHVHALDYVVVPSVNGVVRAEDAASERIVDMQAGVSYARRACIDHKLVNVNEHGFRFVAVELR
ncbi:MAG TPA: hypothetical protein VFV66_34995 [Nonomuraea sp.]|nr:hypothetical protein [Nonomuraea sp.]